jgi:hypothetical protein
MLFLFPRWLLFFLVSLLLLLIESLGNRLDKRAVTHHVACVWHTCTSSEELKHIVVGNWVTGLSLMKGTASQLIVFRGRGFGHNFGLLLHDYTFSEMTAVRCIVNIVAFQLYTVIGLSIVYGFVHCSIGHHHHSLVVI